MSNSCTLELGLRELRMLEVTGGRPTGHAEIDLPQDAYRDGMPTRAFSQALATLVQERSVGGRPASLAISDVGLAVRDFRLPLMGRADLRSAVTYEGRRLVPLDPADAYYAWHARRLGREYAIYLVAARREMVDGIIAAVSAAGLKVSLIDLKALALARGGAVTDGLIVEWGRAEATLAVLAGGRPRFFRTLQLDAPFDDPAGQFDEVAVSIEALVRFVRSAEPDLGIDSGTPLYLAGRFAVLPGADEQARNRLNLSVRWPKPAVRWPAGFPWEANLAGLGLLERRAWQSRIKPSQGGDSHVAA